MEDIRRDIRDLAATGPARPAPGGKRMQAVSFPLGPGKSAGHALPPGVRRFVLLYQKRFDNPTSTELGHLVERLYVRECMFENNFIRTYSTDLMLVFWRALAACFSRIEVDVLGVTARVTHGPPPPLSHPPLTGGPNDQRRAIAPSAAAAPAESSAEMEAAARGSAGATAGQLPKHADERASPRAVPPSAAVAAAAGVAHATGAAAAPGPAKEAVGSASGGGGVDVGIGKPSRAAAVAGSREVVELEVESRQRWYIPKLLPLVRMVFGDSMNVSVVSTLTFAPNGRVLRQRDSVANWLTAPAPLRFACGLLTPAVSTLVGW